MAPASGIRLTEAAEPGRGERPPAPVPAAPPFATLFAARLTRAAARFTASAPQAPLLSPAALDSAKTELLQRLLERASPVLLEEALLRQAVQQSTVPWLPGANSGGPPSLGGLSALLTPPAWDEALSALPALAALLDQTETDWVSALRRLTDSLAAAWPSLGAVTGPLPPRPQPGAIIALAPNLSDPHDGGKTTAIVTLRGGGTVVYKPRDLTMEHRFQQLVAWLRAHGAGDLLHAVPVLHRGSDDGWMAFAGHAPCQSMEEIGLYFERAGALLCLVAMLQGTDIHRENIIAQGAWPILVDAETLFQPRPVGTAPESPDLLLRDTGMLPSHGPQTRSDFSALCARSGAATDIRVHTLEGGSQSAYCLPEAHNLPVLDGIAQTAHEHRDRVIAGFTALYRLLLRHRAALTATDGPLAAFATVPGRYLAKGTQRYGLLISSGLAATEIRAPASRASRLRTALRAHAPHPLPDDLEEQELRALLNADIPRLGFLPGTTGPQGAWPASLDQVFHRLCSLDDAQGPAWADAIARRLQSPGGISSPGHTPHSSFGG